MRQLAEICPAHIADARDDMIDRSLLNVAKGTFIDIAEEARRDDEQIGRAHV